MLAHDLIARAVRAPSSHNTQPWAFRAAGDAIALFADRTRALAVNDPFDRELTVSCGAALRTLEVAAAASGVGTGTVLVPGEGDADHLATVTVGGPPDPDAAALSEAIERRHTTRDAFAPGAPSGERTAEWTARALTFAGCGLDVIGPGPRREALAELVAAGDRAQFADARWRRELAGWMHPRRRGDGLTVPGLAAPIVRAVVRRFDLGDRTASKDRELLVEAPWVAVLTTETDDERAWLEAGRALQSLLLAAALDGCAAGYLNQPCQVAALRPRLARELGLDAHPQVVVRVGPTAGNESPSPRRPVAEVLWNEG